MRTREEQVADIENFCGTLVISGDTPNSHAIREWLKEAEERGFKRYLLKKTDHAAIGCSPSIKQWQYEQNEYFDPTIIEIVEEYAEWRDKQGAECAADTQRLDWLADMKVGVDYREEFGWGVYEILEGMLGEAPTLRAAIDAAMEGGK